MSEHAVSDVAELSAAVSGLSDMVRARSRRLARDSHELRRLSAQLAQATELLEQRLMTDAERERIA